MERSDGKHPLLSKMLHWQGLESFLKADPTVVEAAGANEEDIRTKTRLMALLALASSNSQISFATIQVGWLGSSLPIASSLASGPCCSVECVCQLVSERRSSLGAVMLLDTTALGGRQLGQSRLFWKLCYPSYSLGLQYPRPSHQSRNHQMTA